MCEFPISPMDSKHRRSRKHILDWLGRPDFRESLNTLLAPSGVEVGEKAIYRPLGHHDDTELQLPDFCQCHRPDWKVHEALRSWWLPDSPLNTKARTPVWDFISTCSISEREGLLLVEAKAHEGELDWQEKRLEPTASKQSRINHAHIQDSVSLMSHRLGRLCGEKVTLGIESHYQLANRVAWSAFLANRGIPVALLYLGFTEDKGRFFLKIPERFCRFLSLCSVLRFFKQSCNLFVYGYLRQPF
jgi:hypothetical protein